MEGLIDFWIESENTDRVADIVCDELECEEFELVGLLDSIDQVSNGEVVGCIRDVEDAAGESSVGVKHVGI